MMYHTSFPFLSMIQSWLSNESSYSSHPRARGLGEKYFALQIYSNITDCSRSSSPNSQPFLSSALEHLLWRIHQIVFCSLSWYAGLLPFCRKRKWLIRSWKLEASCSSEPVSAPKLDNLHPSPGPGAGASAAWTTPTLCPILYVSF